MRKFVKFRFTLSTLSVMECILLMLSDLRVRSAIVNGLHFWSESKGLKMKTYTLTWIRPSSWRKNGIRRCRCRFEKGSFYWVSAVDTAVGNFCRLIPVLDCVRLVKCGQLVAGFATYQGV